jgi:hypothetical protein
MQGAFEAGQRPQPLDERRTIDFSDPNALQFLPPALE